MVTSKALNLFENFNQITPYAVGFDRMFDQLSNYTNNNRASTGFPPYNIRKGGEYTYVIEMAVAGFGKKILKLRLKIALLLFVQLKKTISLMMTFIVVFPTVNLIVNLHSLMTLLLTVLNLRMVCSQSHWNVWFQSTRSLVLLR